MTLIESQSVEVMRLRLDHIERELAQIKTRLKAQPLPEPMPFPVATARGTVFRIQKNSSKAYRPPSGRCLRSTATGACTLFPSHCRLLRRAAEQTWLP